MTAPRLPIATRRAILLAMKHFFALFALLALVIGPVAPAIAVPVVAEHCASMSAHHDGSKSDSASAHQCCISAMPSLPDRVAEVSRPLAMTPDEPVAVVPTLLLAQRPHIELRPPRTA
jgi:hypothetical protein